MKATKKYLLLAAAVCSLAAKAQYNTSAYFMDGYFQGHELNPAKDYDRKAYFTVLPIITGTNVGMRGNMGLSSLVKPLPNSNQLGTFLHPELRDWDPFHKNNKLIADMKLNILQVGFRGMGGFNTIGINMRANVGMNVPYDFFDFARTLENRDYSFTNLGATGTAWMEVALGHSRKLTDDLRFGAKVKVLAGAGHFSLKATDVHLDLSAPDKWTAIANAEMQAGVKGFTFGAPDAEGKVDFDNIDIDSDKLGLGGMGAAVDLGIEYDCKKWAPGLKLSAAVVDLGFIKWKDMAVARNTGKQVVIDFDKVNFKTPTLSEGNVNYTEDNNLDNQLSQLGDDLEEIINLQDAGNESKAKMLGATINVAAEYALPQYDKLKFGLLSTTRLQGEYSWNEERLNVTLSPCKLIEFSVSGAYGTLGANWGAAINFHPRGFSVFLGMDHWLGKLSKQGVPLKSNADFTIGICYPIGKSVKKSKKDKASRI